MKKIIGVLLILVVISMFFSTVGFAGEAEVRLWWDVCTDPDCTAYRIYEFYDPNGWVKGSNYVNMTNCAVDHYIYPDLKTDGTYYYIVTTVDGDGNESEGNNMITVEIDVTALPDPNNLFAEVLKQTITYP